MKILLCTNAFEHVTNGPAKFAQLILHINKFESEHQVAILTEDTHSNSKYEYALHLSIPSWLRPAGMFVRMWAYHRKAKKLHATSFPFQILVYNNAIVSLRSALSFKPVIGFINDDNNASISWRSGLLRFKWSRKHLFFITEWLATRLCSSIVVNSDYLQQYVIKRYRANPAKIVRLYKAIDTPLYTSERHNTQPVILFVKNDFERGGLFTLLNAIHSLNRPVKLQVAGPPESARKKIETAARNLDVELQFLGIQSQDTIFSLMRKADVFCVPSYREALGVANMEAIACGCAVVSTNTGGITEVLDHGQHGWLVEPGDAEALARALTEAIDNNPLRIQKIQSGQASLHRFQKDVLLNNFIAIMKKHVC